VLFWFVALANPPSSPANVIGGGGAGGSKRGTRKEQTWNKKKEERCRKNVSKRAKCVLKGKNKDNKMHGVIISLLGEGEHNFRRVGVILFFWG
jgi:hypothetical protein